MRTFPIWRQTLSLILNPQPSTLNVWAKNPLTLALSPTKLGARGPGKASPSQRGQERAKNPLTLTLSPTKLGARGQDQARPRQRGQVRPSRRC